MNIFLLMPVSASLRAVLSPVDGVHVCNLLIFQGLARFQNMLGEGFWGLRV